MIKKQIEFDFLKRDKELNKGERIAKIITLLTISPFQIVAYLSLAGGIFPIWIYPLLNTLVNTISGIFFLLIPLLPLIILNRRSRLEGGQLSRDDRYIIFLSIIPGYLILIFIYNIIGVSMNVLMSPLINFVISYIVILLIEFIITIGLKFKTSMHVSGAVCSITSMSFYFGGLILLLLLFVIIIAWARWKIKGHTIPQLISGWVIGIFITMICQIILLTI